MQAESQQEVSPQTAAALIAYLRQNPDHIRRDPTHLASQFNLNEAFVRNVLDGLQPPEFDDGYRSRRWSFSFLGRFWAMVARLFEKATRRPIRFVGFTTLLCVIVSMGSALAPQSHHITFANNRISIEDTTMLLAIITTFGLHMGCYFRRQMARYALYGALIVWVVTAMIAMIGVWLDMQGKQETSRFAAVMGTGLAMFFISLLYAGAGSMAAVAGGWLAMKLHEREQERMSRQDLLTRYFELQTRLQKASNAKIERLPWVDLAPIIRFQQHPYAWSFALGLVISTVLTLLVGALSLDSNQVMQSMSPIGIVQMVLLVAISLASFLTYVGLGFFCGRVWRAIGSSILYSIGGLIPTLLPVGNFGPRYFASGSHLIQQAIAIPGFAMVSAFAAVGAIVQSRAIREKGLQSNDQASIIAEMLRIQWRLSDHVSNVCVMVVDAAKSSVMKAEADPLAVEYSFREYQEWLEAIGRQYGGRVHSTAGDGAVLSFENCEDALEAARMVQGDLPRFNQDTNQLRSPFRLRIGLHTGQVAGDIDEVQFTEVIDIAAHIQEVAPIAGIAMTDDVAASLPQEQVVPLAVEVDGHHVFLVMQPTT